MKQNKMKITINSQWFVITPWADTFALEESGVSRPQNAQNLRGLLASVSYGLAQSFPVNKNVSPRCLGEEQDPQKAWL